MSASVAKRAAAPQRAYRCQVFEGRNGLYRFDVRREGDNSYIVTNTTLDHRPIEKHIVIANTCDQAMSTFLKQWTPF